MSDIPLHYRTAYQWTGESAAGDIHIDGPAVLPVGTPHDAERYSPEHLLVVAAETCLANYVLLIAEMSKLDVKDYRSTAEGELIKEDKVGYRFKRILLRPELTVEASNESQAQRILKKAHDLCLIARSLNCPVDMEPVVKTG
ncbi:OsmC family protein [Thiocapsa marina]|uniref:OsmC family protein n=1 Tax=Thiocapsa marina 5811 TaxID=768671 RepID=F9U6V0_9GAMM|nr:OsmC family protein [Thiocapsa marina]EGV19976.1 OsmC family protein [Thiocapsa marina 5811]